jgi:hypothetical protein
MAVIARTILKRVDMESYIKKDFLDKIFNRNGLCAYCQRKHVCCFTDDTGLVFDCDDYEPGEEAFVPLTFSTLDLGREDDEEIYGLCANCQIKDICQLKNINGGVWHCEEYQ